MASSSSRKQQIRPRYLDLSEFDEDEPGEDAFSNWPPAATVVRKAPPSIKTSKSGASSSADQGGTAGKAAVEDALQETRPSASTGSLPDADPKTVRFQTDSEPASSHQHHKSRRPTSAGNDASFPYPAASVSSSLSMIGTVQERPKGQKSPTRNPAAKSRASRFVVSRQMDEELRQHDKSILKDTLGRNTGFPLVTHRDQIDQILPSSGIPASKVNLSEDILSVPAPESDNIAIRSATQPSGIVHGPDLEEWLDETGRPMSAFRKSRLLRQGLRPPSVRRVHDDEDASPSHVPDPTRDPGGGADIDAISAVLAEVSRENDQKLRQMSSAEITEEVKDLESLFSKDVLEGLRSRKKIHGESVMTTSRSLSSSEMRARNQPEESSETERIRRQYFPKEPGGARPELEWLLPQTQTDTTVDREELRFDFRGVLLETRDQTDKSYLSGLHHHGDNQTAPGYTFQELVHFTRSSVAAQRQLALNVLGRICERYPTFAAGDTHDGQARVVRFLNSFHLLPRARTIMLARWLLGDRNFSVRSAALRCLASVLRSIPSATERNFGVTLHTDWRMLHENEEVSREDQSDASYVERSIQIDWASTMLKSKIMPLLLDQTDAVITSHGDAETALEVLCRIASCSASHALRVFGADSKKVCDFVIHLGLQVTWPPVQGGSSEDRHQNFDAAPSLWALRLLHVGVLADRQLAQSMVQDGSIDHLLRFVASPPWTLDAPHSKPEADPTILHAYNVFDVILQIYISLASYGIYASLAGRFWSLWQESGIWAMTVLKDAHADNETSKSSVLVVSKHKVAQSVFMLLAAWTRCSQDPHQLLGHHDVTWTQVRDWIKVLEAIPDLSVTHESETKLQHRRAEEVTGILGAVCQFTAIWLDCALQKDSIAIKRSATTCRQLFIYSNDAIRSALHSQLQSFSSTNLLSQVEDVENAVQSARSLQRLAGVLSRVSATSDVTQADLTAVRENTFHDIALLVQCSALWCELDSKQARATGGYIVKETLTSFVASTVIDDVTTSETCIRNLVAVSRLDATYSDLVASVILKSSAHLGGEDVANILKPFLLECADSTTYPGKTNAPIDRPLSEVTCLFRQQQERSPVIVGANVKDEDDADQHEQEEGEDKDDLDPITGTKLWRCRASSLPLRADWPLLALDDLLHSATTAVFNRPNNLEADWQANELDIVRASLGLAVKTFACQFTLFESSLSSTELSAEVRAALSRLPSAEQILLGVIKVFMLEKDQPDTFVDKRVPGSKQQRPSGALTGRDLFRDTTVSSHIASLLDFVDKLVELRRQDSSKLFSTTTLEAWTTATIGNGVSFYQYFTDLVGLYESISFGDRNFARLIMTIANAGGQESVFEGKTGLAKDFRSLVWNDYRDSLKSMPETLCPSWTLGWFDQDLDMLDLYARFLVNEASQTPPRKSIAYTIAVHHLRPVVQGCASSSVDRASRLVLIGKSLLETCGPHVLHDLLSPSVDRADKLSTAYSAVHDQIQLLNENLGLSLSL